MLIIVSISAYFQCNTYFHTTLSHAVIESPCRIESTSGSHAVVLLATLEAAANAVPNRDKASAKGYFRLAETPSHATAAVAALQVEQETLRRPSKYLTQPWESFPNLQTELSMSTWK